MLPIVCFSCGELLGDKHKEIEDIKKKIKLKPDAIAILLKELGVESYCCRMQIMGTMNRPLK